MTNKTETKIIVMTRSANMPGSCWGRYGRVGVVEIDPAKLPKGRTEPTMLSNRARGVVKIHDTWERQHIGKTNRCAFAKAVGEAIKMRNEMVARHG